MSRVGTGAALLLLGLATMVARAAPSTGHPSRHLTVAEMTALVRVYLAPDRGKYGFGVADIGEESHFHGFRDFDVLTNDPSAFSVYLDHIAVDETTGDLWSANGCGADESPALKKAQRKLREKVGLSDIDYGRLKRPGPYCDGAPYKP